MATKKKPAPRRAGTAAKEAERKAAQQRLRAALLRIAHDVDALQLVDRLVAKMTARSRRRRR